MAEVTVNGVRIAYQQLGEGPDLILVHGLAANRAFWYGAYALPLAKFFRITLFDLRGHGYSERPPSGYTCTDMAGDLAGLVDHLKLDRFMLVGHSYGGSVSVEYACNHSDRIDRLAILDSKVNSVQDKQLLTDSPHLTAFEIEACERTGRDWSQDPQVGLTFLEVLARQRVEGFESKARDTFTPFGEGRGAFRAAKQWLDLIDNSTAMKDFTVHGQGADAISKISVPKLLMYGEHSRCKPSLRGLSALWPDAKVEMVPDGGHFFPLGHRAYAFPRIAGFLGISAEQLAAAAAPSASE
jgi:pimeloyl-ACP methyl ester carboxylesterase